MKKKIELWKIMAAVLAALIIYDILTVVSFVSAAEAVEVPPEVEAVWEYIRYLSGDHTGRLLGGEPLPGGCGKR